MGYDFSYNAIYGTDGQEQSNEQCENLKMIEKAIVFNLA